MKHYVFLLIALLAMGNSCSPQERIESRVQRQPLVKTPHEYKSPTNYDFRDRGYDPKTGKMILYDHKPRIELVDAKSGKYAFKWIGFDGKEKTIIYQRADAIDVIVSANVFQTPEGKYLYTYKIENLPSSGTHLDFFSVQNFALDTKPVEVGGIATNHRDVALLDAFRKTSHSGEPHNVENFHIGQMYNAIEQFKEGYWIAFGTLKDDDPQIIPGGILEIKMLSSSPPDLVGCRVAGGTLTLKGVGEEMPIVLDNAMRSYSEFPYGYTIGPSDQIKSLGSSERAVQLLNKLPQFRSLGWITDEALSRYEKLLKGKNFDSIIKHSADDLEKEQITTEFFALIETIKS